MLNRRTICRLMPVLLAAWVSFAIADEKTAAKPIKSGLPAGEFVPPFNCRDITGPAKGKTLCYRCRYGDSPVVAVFTRNTGEQTASLIKQIDAQVVAKKANGLKAFVVFLSDDPDEIETKIENLAKTEKVSSTPLTIMEGIEGPPEYKIAKTAETTVLMWVNGEVKVNHAFTEGLLDEATIKKIVADTAKIVQ